MTHNANWLTEQSRAALAHGQRVAEIVVIDLAPVFADISVDEFEERFKLVLDEVDQSAGRVVLLLGLDMVDPIAQLDERHKTVRAQLDQAVQDGDWESAARWTYESSQIELAIAAARPGAEHREDDTLVD